MTADKIDQLLVRITTATTLEQAQGYADQIIWLRATAGSEEAAIVAHYERELEG